MLLVLSQRHQPVHRNDMMAEDEDDSSRRLEIAQEIRRQLLLPLKSRNNNDDDANTGAMALPLHPYDALVDQGIDHELCWQLCYEVQQYLSTQEQQLPSDPTQQATSGNTSTATTTIEVLCQCLYVLWSETSNDEVRLTSLVQLLEEGDISTHFGYVPWWFVRIWSLLQAPTLADGAKSDTNEDTMDVVVAGHSGGATPVVSRYIIPIFGIWAKMKVRQRQQHRPRPHQYADKNGPSCSTAAVVKSRLIRSSGLVKMIAETLEVVMENSNRRDDGGEIVQLLQIAKDLSHNADPTDKEFLYSELRQVLVVDYSTNILLNIITRDNGDGEILPDNDKKTSNVENGDESDDERFRNFVNELEMILAFLWNVTVVPRIARSVSNDADVWRVLKMVAIIRQTNETVELRRHLSSVLGTVIADLTATTNAASTSSQPATLLEQLSWLIPHVFWILRHETDADIRRRTMRLIRCLASCEWGRLLLLKKSACDPSSVSLAQDDLLSILIRVVRKSSKDGPDTRSQACQAVALLLPWAMDDWASQTPCLETILIQIIEEDPGGNVTNAGVPTGNRVVEEKVAAERNLVLAACHALDTSLCNSPWKRGPSCFSRQFFDRLTQILNNNVSEPRFHIGISKLLLQIIRDGSSTGQLSTLIERRVLDSVSVLMASVGPDFETSRTNAITMLTAFMDDDIDEGSKKALAGNDSLLAALVNFCLINSGAQKDKVKQIILKLVPEL